MYLEKIFGLKGLVAVVTGGGQGIRQVIACALAKAGAEVFILNRSGADDTVRMIENDGGKGYFISTDVTREEDVEAAFAKIIMQSGSLDIVFNNAGICINAPLLFKEVESIHKNGIITITAIRQAKK